MGRNLPAARRGELAGDVNAMHKRIRVVRKVPRRVRYDDVYTVEGRPLNVALLHAAPGIDINGITDGAWRRLVERRGKP